MCLMIYIGSEKELELVMPDKKDWKFNVDVYRGNDEGASLKRILGLPYIYDAGSHFGCGCGFYFDDNINANNPKEAKNRAMAVRDSMELKAYLGKNLSGNRIKMLLTWWDEEKFAEEEFSLERITEKAFAFEEDIIYTIKP